MSEILTNNPQRASDLGIGNISSRPAGGGVEQGRTERGKDKLAQTVNPKEVNHGILNPSQLNNMSHRALVELAQKMKQEGHTIQFTKHASRETLIHEIESKRTETLGKPTP